MPKSSTIANGAYTVEGVKKLWVRTSTAMQLFEVSDDTLVRLERQGHLHPSGTGTRLKRWKLAELEAHFGRSV